MKFKIYQDSLSAALSLAKSAAARKSSLHVLEMVALEVVGNETLEVRATNLTSTLRVQVPVKQQDSEGAIGVCIPTAAIAYVAKLPKEEVLTLDIQEASIDISCQGENATFQGVPLDEAPLMQDVSEAVTQIDSETLAAALERVTPSTAGDNAARAALGAIHCMSNGDVSVAFESTDGFRGSRVEVEVSYTEDFDINLPRDTGVLLGRLLKLAPQQINVFADAQRVSFSGEGWTVSAQLVNAQFPDMAPVWPSTFALEFDVLPATMVKKLARLGIIAQDVSQQGYFYGDNGDLFMSAASTESGTAKTAVPSVVKKGTVGDDKIISVNVNYLSQALAPMEEATIKVESSNAPLVVSESLLPHSITSSEFLVMPMVIK